MEVNFFWKTVMAFTVFNAFCLVADIFVLAKIHAEKFMKVENNVENVEKS